MSRTHREPIKTLPPPSGSADTTSKMRISESIQNELYMRLRSLTRFIRATCMLFTSLYKVW
uniref:Uncharacterized protein n=1 Tax=Anguilla anguilla TaxID=7936 RepID=A0A0E9QV61_ANGAN